MMSKMTHVDRALCNCQPARFPILYIDKMDASTNTSFNRHSALDRADIYVISVLIIITYLMLSVLVSPTGRKKYKRPKENTMK